MSSDRRHRPILATTSLALALLVTLAPAQAARVLPKPVPPDIERPAEPAAPPAAPALCPERQVDVSGDLVEQCAVGGEEPDYAVRVHPTPFDTGRGDWVVRHQPQDSLRDRDLLALFGSGTATVKHAIAEIIREAMVGESWLGDGLQEIEATVERRPVAFIASAVILFALIFGGAVAWVLVRRARRHRRRLNAGRRTAAALMGELVSIRDNLRDLALDSRPGRLDDLERVAASTNAYARHQEGLRLIDRGASTLIIGFYRELHALPEPFIEERAGKLGTHRVLRLEAADDFASQAEALAGRANELAGVLRQWLDRNVIRE